MAIMEWKGRYRRLTAMDRKELRYRLRQQIAARTDFLKFRLGANLSPKLTPGNASEQPNFFFSGETIPSLCSLLRQRFPGRAEEIILRAERICEHRFDLLGYEDLDYGKEIDWHCDRVHGKQAPRTAWYKIRYLDFAEVGDSKVIWELNRHQHLVTLAKAYRLSGDHKFATELFRQWKSWHRENPYPIGVNWASSLEVAFRSLSWLWMYFLLRDSQAMVPRFRSQWLQSLGVSARHIDIHLSRYFSPNTHLLGEGVALFFVGMLCPELSSAQRWRERGWEIVQQEAKRQVRTDGFHFEQSTYYHVYALDFFLHAGVLASLNNFPTIPAFDDTLERMLEVLCLLGRSGEPPRFGDDDGGRLFDPQRNRARHLLDPLSTGAVLFGRGDFKGRADGLREETLWLLGQEGVTEFDRIQAADPAPASVRLQDSGLHIMADGSSTDQLVIDAGPQGVQTAGHGHADALSVLVFSDGHALLTDPGTYEYVGGGNGRARFRGTGAHNTLSIDGLDQADPEGPFAWRDLPNVVAEAWINGRSFDLFVGRHDGYARLPNPVVHRRSVFSLKSRFWVVRDLLFGTGSHQLDLFWHLAPELSCSAGKTENFIDPQGGKGLRVLAVGPSGCSRTVVEGEWSPAYGRRQPCQTLHVSSVSELPAEFVTLLIPLASSDSDTSRIEKIQDSSKEPVSAFRYQTDAEEHYIFLGEGETWTLSGWSSDAKFLYWGVSRDRSRFRLICCGFTFVEAKGRRVVSSPQAALRCEIVKENEQTDVLCSNQAAVVSNELLDGLAAALVPALTLRSETGRRTR
jgi:hypothetical protein